MIIGNYLKYVLIGTSLTTIAADEEPKRRIGSRKLPKNRGYGDINARAKTIAPIDNVDPFLTLSVGYFRVNLSQRG